MSQILFSNEDRRCLKDSIEQICKDISGIVYTTLPAGELKRVEVIDDLREIDCYLDDMGSTHFKESITSDKIHALDSAILSTLKSSVKLYTECRILNDAEYGRDMAHNVLLLRRSLREFINNTHDLIGLITDYNPDWDDCPVNGLMIELSCLNNNLKRWNTNRYAQEKSERRFEYAARVDQECSSLSDTIDEAERVAEDGFDYDSGMAI